MIASSGEDFGRQPEMELVPLLKKKKKKASSPPPPSADTTKSQQSATRKRVFTRTKLSYT